MSDSSVFDDLEAEMEDTGRSLADIIDDARADESSRGALKRELKTEARETGQNLSGLLEDVKQRADENDRDVVDQLKREFDSFRSN